MTDTDHDLLRWTTSAMIHDLKDRRDNEWHTGDSYDEVVWKIDRLERFHEYVKLDKQFGP